MTLPGIPPALALPPDSRLARLVRVDRGSYDVRTAAGDCRLPALPPPQEATVGDWLAVDDERVVAVLPRTSLLVRAAPSGHSRPQLLAANVDTVLVCAGLTGTLPVRRIERLLTLVWESGATPLVVLTKADLHPDPEAAVQAVRPHAPGVPIVAVNAVGGDVADLASRVTPGATLVLLGASGAGKSTVVNALAGSPVMSTGPVRDGDGKGRHTTTHRQLIELPGGTVLIDTPGLRGVGLTGSHDGFEQAFADIVDLARACRFADCAHGGEPGCAVEASIAAGDLSAARMQSWRRLQRELAFEARRLDLRRRQEDKARSKALHRQQRARGARP